MAPSPIAFLAGAGALTLTVAAGVAAAPAGTALPCGRVVDKVVCQADASQSYALYLPSGYDPARRWPVLFCFDPGGRGRVPVERFQAAAEKFGYVVTGSNNSRNGPWAENITAIAALMNDAAARFSLDARRRYAAGFSGGARTATAVAATGLVKGVIACSAAFTGGETPAQVSFVLFGTAGCDDFNYPEMRRTDLDLDSRGSPHRVVFFPGGHDWLPPALAMEAVGWLDLQAMRAGIHPTDAGFIRSLFEQRRAAAAALPPAEAWREYKSLAADFAGLADTAEAVRRAAALQRSREVRTWRKRENLLEDRQRDMNDDLFSMAQDGRWASVRETAATLRQEAAAPEDSPERRLARRVLEGMGIAGVEQARLFSAQRQYGEAVMYMELAASLHPQSAQTLYDLARVRARNGERPAALEALAAAVAAGFVDAPKAENDAAFAAIRTEARFQALIAAMRK